MKYIYKFPKKSFKRLLKYESSFSVDEIRENNTITISKERNEELAIKTEDSFSRVYSFSTDR